MVLNKLEMYMKKYIKNFLQYQFLLSELVKKEIKLKYRRSYLGIIWSLLEPLLTMIVLTIVFGTLYDSHTREFPVYILTGRLLYSMFSTSTKSSLTTIRKNSAMIKKVYVPKYLYVLSTVLFNYVIFLISLIVLAVVGAFLGVPLTVYIFQAVVPLILILMMSYGCGMILATVGVFFRDMEYLWSVILMLIMYTCAIFYYPDKLLGSGYKWILKYNPLYCIIDLFRSAVFGELMDMRNFIYAGVFSLISIVAGVVCFKVKQDDFIMHI
jgi:ABC-2 type transport system permease protein